MNAKSIGLGRAIRMGLALATESLPSTLLAFGFEMFQVLLDVAGFWLCGLMLTISWKALAAAGGAVACASLVLTFAKALLGSGFIFQIQARLRNEDVPRLGEAWAKTSLTALQYFLFSIVAEWLFGFWKFLSFFACATAFTLSLSKGILGEWSASSLSLWLLLVGPLSLFLSLWLRIGWVRALAGKQSLPGALFDAAGILAAKPWQYVGASLIFGTLSLVLGMTLAGMGNAFQMPLQDVTAQMKMSLWTQLLVGLLASCVAAYTFLSHLACVCVLDLDAHGQLPSSDEVLTATPVAEIVSQETAERGQNVGE